MDIPTFRGRIMLFFSVQSFVLVVRASQLLGLGLVALKESYINISNEA